MFVQTLGREQPVTFQHAGIKTLKINFSEIKDGHIISSLGHIPVADSALPQLCFIWTVC